MNDCTVIIPSAKLVPESLQNLGRLPAVIYPVSQITAFDYLYEQYSGKASRIKVICCENAEEVIRKLSPYGSSVSIKILPELKDLGYTVYEGLEGETGTVIINFADTIIADNICSYDGDCFFYSEDYLSDTWTFFAMNDLGAFTKITDKKPPSGSFGREKLFAGVFRISAPQDFRRCLEDAFSNPDRETGSFYQALNDYSRAHPMKAIEAHDWFDIGHADKYFNSRLEVSAREFNHITIDRTRGILYKASDSKEKFIQEIKWYLKLPSYLEYTHPRIFSYSTHYTKPYIAMEYYAYHTIHELFLYGDLNLHQWRNILLRVRSVYDDLMRYTVRDSNIRSSLEDMYLTKKLERLGMLRNSKDFSGFFSDSITINGTKYISLEDICTALKQHIPEILYEIDSFSIIHGDLCFTNIMIDPNLSFIKLIDPRGSFGAYDIYGDPRYDLAKLLHSIEGRYDFIIKDLFTIDFDLNTSSVSYKISDSGQNFDLSELFMQVFSPDIKSVRLIEALLFLSMIPLHGESLKHQLAMLGTGIEILSRIIPITKE